MLELFSIVLSCHFFAIEMALFSTRFKKIWFLAIFFFFLACLLLWMSCYHLWYSLEVTLFYLNDFESGAREQFHALGVTPVNFEGGGSRFKTWRTPFRWLREVTIIHNHQNQGYPFKSILKQGIKFELKFQKQTCQGEKLLKNFSQGFLEFSSPQLAVIGSKLAS